MKIGGVIPVEEKPDKDTYCRSCKKYQRKSTDGKCLICGGKLSTYTSNRRYFTKDSIEKRRERGKVINVPARLERQDAQYRDLSRKFEKLELRYQQIINLLRAILRFNSKASKRMRTKDKLTMAKIIQYIEQVVDEPEELEVNLVDDIINWKEVKE